MNATRSALYPPTPPALRPACKDAWHLLTQAMRRCTDAWRRWRLARARQRELRDLVAIGDHLLRDIGIDRNELQWLAKYPKDPTRAWFTAPA